MNTNAHTHFRGDYKTVQCGSVAVTSWLDRRLVCAMSTAHDPTIESHVLRRQRDGTRMEVSCPMIIKSYNENMGGVDSGDQARGYYRMRTKFRKFYMYIYTFLLDVAITNAHKLAKHNSQLTPALKEFRRNLATELIGDYNSRKNLGRRAISIRPLPLTHFPTKHQEGKRGECEMCKPKRKDTPWQCTTCNKWLCHNGNPRTDCYLHWHKQ